RLPGGPRRRALDRPAPVGAGRIGGLPGDRLLAGDLARPALPGADGDDRRRPRLGSKPSAGRADRSPSGEPGARASRSAPRSTIPRVSGPTVLIMAAGEGTRMRSSVPKVLHDVCGR